MKSRVGGIALGVTLLVLSMFTLVPTGPPRLAASMPNTPFSWNPKVPCTPLVARITDITSNSTGSASFSESPFSPGTTPPVSGGDAKRWLTPGPTPSGWVSPGPACTVTNQHGTRSLFVEIDGVKRSSLTNEDWSTLYDPSNGGNAHSSLTGDTTFNLFDPVVIPSYSSSCTSAADPTCYGRIHGEIDHDWKAAGYCGAGTLCDNATLASQTMPDSTLIDVQGFVYWDAGGVNANWHQFSGWEIHPVTAWKLSSSPPPVPFTVLVSPTKPQVGDLVAFSASPSNGTEASSFSWDFGDGVTASGSSVFHIFVSAQSFTVHVNMIDDLGKSFTTFLIVNVGSWNSAVNCVPTLTTLEGVLGNVSIQRLPSDPNSIGADYSGGGFKLDGVLSYGSNPSTWPFFKRDISIPCKIGGTPTFVEFHNVTVINKSKEDCSTTYSSDNGGGAYPNGWQSCDITFTLATPGYGDDSCPACYMHRLYAGIDRDWNASGIGPSAPVEGQRIDVQGFVYWNDASVNATFHSFTGWELHPIAAWQVTRLPVIAGISYAPSNPTSAQAVNFTGTASGGTGPYTFNWDFGDGTVSTGSNATHTYSPGTYTVHLSTRDSGGVVGTAAGNVTVIFPPDFALSVSPSSMAFPAGTSASTTVNISSVHGFGSTLSLTMLAASGLTGSFSPSNVTLAAGGSATSTLFLSSTTPGSYTVVVIASSGSLSHYGNLTVNVVDVGPTVAFSESTNNAFRDQTIVMTISASDLDGFVTSIRVTWGDGSIDYLPGNALTDSHAYVAAGTYTVSVTATDNVGLSSTATATNIISDAPPVSAFTQSLSTAPTGTIVSFDGSSSSDFDGTIVSYAWNFGDGSSGTGVSTNHSYSIAGDYTVTLMVTDNATLTGSASSAVHVTDRPPTVSFTASTTSSPTGTAIILTFNSIDPDGAIESITVSWGDGTVDALSGNTTTVSHSYVLAGAYSVYVNATDNAGLVTQSGLTILNITDRPPALSISELANSAFRNQPITITITSSDPDGTVTSLHVDWGDGTVDPLPSNATTAKHAYVTAGTFTANVTVIDDAGLSSSATTVNTITDSPPIAGFTQSLTTVPTGTVISFDGSTSHDPDGTILAYSWNFGDGSTAIDPSPTHSYSVAGDYTVTLTVTDNATLTGSTSQTIHVTDSPPSVSFLANPSTANTGQMITLTILSQDPDGTIVQTMVDWGDGTVHNIDGHATNDTHVYLNTGNSKTQTLTIFLSVNDNAGLSGTDMVEVTINDVAPIAMFTQTNSSELTGVNIGFDAMASSDPDGNITSYLWNFGDGSTSSGITVTHAYSNTDNSPSRIFTVSLAVTDNAGNTATTASQLTIFDRAPSASFTQSASSALTLQNISFDANASNDPDGTVLSYAWDFGDGSTGVGSVVSHSYTSSRLTLSKTYTVNLTVVDDAGNNNTVTHMISVLDRPPVSSFTATPTTSYTHVGISFNATSSTDLDGNIASYAWIFGDGSNAAGAAVTHSYAVSGNYTVILTVTDDSGSQTDASATITILDRPPVTVAWSSSTSSPTLVNISFYGIGSYDPDGVIIGYAWNFGDGSTGSGITTSHSYTMAGNYTVVLGVTDNSGLVTFGIIVETILDRAPTAAFTFSPNNPVVGQAMNLDASSSSDIDGTIVGFAWSFGDGLSGTGARVSHSYATNGTFTIVLTVSDDSGSVESAVSTISVGIDPAPAWPSGSTLTTSRIGPRDVWLAWSSAVDSAQVTHYRIFVNGTLWAEVDGNTTAYHVTGLTEGLLYVFQVQAGNPSGNWSSDGPSASALTYLTGDVNHDCRVNIVDLSTVGASFGSTSGDPKYNPAADLNGDGSVNIIDLSTVGANFGQTC